MSKVRMLMVGVILGVMLLPAFAQTANQPINIDQATAQQTALSLYPSETIVSIERETEDGIAVWDVKLSNGIAVYIHSQTGNVVEIERWSGAGRNEARMAMFILPESSPTPIEIGTDGVDVNEAQQIALSYYPDSTILEVTLEREDGLAGWEVVLSNGMVITLESQTGTLLELDVMSEGKWDNCEKWDD